MLYLRKALVFVTRKALLGSKGKTTTEKIKFSTKPYFGKLDSRFTMSANELSDDESIDQILVNSITLDESISVPKSKREVICGDSIEWLNAMKDTFPPGYCGFTSLPDITELQTIFTPDQFEEYKLWFTDAVALFMSKMPVNSYMVFLQSDVRVIKDNTVIHWIDKSHLCSTAADRSGCALVWHKLVLLNDNLNKRSTGRPTYSHLVCYHKKSPSPSNIIKSSSSSNSSSEESVIHDPMVTNYRPAAFSIPDVFYRGDMVWSKGIGLDCCYAGVVFLKEVVGATCIVDPFAGQGTVIAMANALGVDALGVEISLNRCKKARRLNLTDKLHLVSKFLKNISLEVDKPPKLNKHIPRSEYNKAKTESDSLTKEGNVNVEVDSSVCLVEDYLVPNSIGK